MISISVITPTIRPEGLKVVSDSLKKQTFKDFEWLIEVNVSGVPDLNKAMNRMIRRAQGDLIVSVQDFLELPEDGLEKFWEAHLLNSRAFFTAPVGITHDWKNIKWDWRIQKEKCSWQEWEIDWGATPRQALIKMGGFDENLDEYWGFDNVNVALRAELHNYDFVCLKDNKAIAYDHNKDMKHPFMHLRNVDYHNYRLDQIRMGQFEGFL